MRATTLLNQLLDLPGITARSVSFPSPGQVVVDVALRRQRLVCPECGRSSRARYDRRHVWSRWRHLDFGRWQIEVRAQLRRLCCPVHGVRTEAVTFARPGAGFTRDFEDLIAWLATKMDKTAICRYARIDSGHRRAHLRTGGSLWSGPGPLRRPWSTSAWTRCPGRRITTT